MLPRLQAEETLDAVTAAQLGAGVLKKADATQILSRLERRANPGPRQPADPRALASIGIAVEEVA